MKHFYLYILLLCFIIIAVSTFTHYYKYYILREKFGNNKVDKTYILLGDSIIKNNSYVKNGKGIDDILSEKTDGNTHCYAKDDSKIVDIYSQLDIFRRELRQYDKTTFAELEVIKNKLNQK